MNRRDRRETGDPPRAMDGDAESGIRGTIARIPEFQILNSEF